MAEPAEDLREALAEALEESKFPTDELVAEEDWSALEEAPAASDGEGSSKDTALEPGKEAEATAQLEIPEFYKGMGLEDLPAETAQAVLAQLQQQESYIHQLQARLAKEPEAPATQAPEPPGEVTDEALLIALGFDPSDEYGETAQVAPHVLPLARTILDLETKVEQLVNVEGARQAENHWNSTLDQLESTYGKLPVSRPEALRYAIEENLTSPFEAYFAISAPVKKEVGDAISAARRASQRTAEAGGVRPRATATGDPTITKDMSLREATRAAMIAAEKESGIKWRNLFKGGKIATE